MTSAKQSPVDELAVLEARRLELLAAAKEENRPALEEAMLIVSDAKLKAAMVRLGEIGSTLTAEPSAVNVRMMLNALTQSYGGAVNVIEAGLK